MIGIGTYTQIEVDEAEIKQIFNEIHKAETTIYESYRRLRNLGVIKVKNSQTENEVYDLSEKVIEKIVKGLDECI